MLIAPIVVLGVDLVVIVVVLTRRAWINRPRRGPGVQLAPGASIWSIHDELQVLAGGAAAGTS
jgi:hypothetical protein